MLIGVEKFCDDDYPPLPTCRGSIDKLYDLLTDQHGNMWRLSPEQVNLVTEPITADDAQIALEAAVEREDVHSLLVCISTHGRRYDLDLGPPGLHLAMSTSRGQTPRTHWRFDEISKVLERARRRIRHIVLIIDACYAHGLAVGPEVSGMAGASAASLKLAVPGVTVLTATKDSRIAWPEWWWEEPGGKRRESPYTAFLGSLIDSIEAGATGLPEILSARQVFEAAERRIADAQLTEPRIPSPDIFSRGSGEIPLCVNKLKEPGEQPLGKAGIPLTADACFAEFVAHSAMQRNELVQDFCRDRDVSADQVASLVQKFESNGFSEYRKNVYGSFCAARSPADIALFADRLHLIDLDVDEPLIVKSLYGREKAARVAWAVHISMQESGCDDCARNAEAIGDLIASSDKLRNEALGVWRGDVADGAWE